MQMPRIFARIACATLLATVLVAAPTTSRAEETAPQSGVFEGVLTAKSDRHIMVRADGEPESRKFVPRWIGGLPKNGGGLDKTVLAAFSKLTVNSRIKVAWVFSERLRVTDIQVLALPGGNGGATQGDGAFRGIVTAKGENWISVRPDGERESQKFVPRWVGGMPKNGGGYNKEMLASIAQTQVGAHMRIEWVFEEHPRVVVLRPVQ